MRRRAGHALALCALTLTPAAARAEDASLVLKPSSDWVLDYADNSCALRRAFGDGPQKAYLELDNFALWDSFRVTVMEQGIGLRRRSPRTRFEPESELRKQQGVLYGTFAEGREGVLYTDTLMSEADLDAYNALMRKDVQPKPWDETARDKRESEITGLYIADTFDRDLLLQTGPLHRPMNAMRTCITDLMTHLGIDPVKMRSLSRGVTSRHQPSWARKFVAGVITSKLMHRGQRTALQVHMIVDEQGKPVDCYARDEGQDEAFNTLSCERLMEVAQFDPALDADGKPTRGVWVTRIYYLP